jgi:RPA family protein
VLGKSSNSYYEFLKEDSYKFSLRPEGMSEADTIMHTAN